MDGNLLDLNSIDLRQHGNFINQPNVQQGRHLNSNLILHGNSNSNVVDSNSNVVANAQLNKISNPPRKDVIEIIGDETLQSEEIRRKLHISNLALNSSGSGSPVPLSSPYLARPKTVEIPTSFPRATPSTSVAHLTTLAPLLRATAPFASAQKSLAKCKLELAPPEFNGKDLPHWQIEFLEFLELTGRLGASDEDKCRLILGSVKKPEVKTLLRDLRRRASSFGEFLSFLEEAFPSLESDAKIIQDIRSIPALPETPAPHQVTDLRK